MSDASQSLPDNDAGFWQRLRRFMNIIYEPRQHLLFAALWYLSIQGLFVSVSGNPSGNVSDTLNGNAWPWQWGWQTLAGVATFFIALFTLRAIDEVKDFEYDCRFNPERPLVCGAISVSDVRWYVAIALLVLPLLNLPFSPWLALFMLLNIAYGLLLIRLEQWLPKMQTSIFFNLLITYPVSIALSFYTLLQVAIVTAVPVTPVSFLVILAYILAFLHFEIVRKTRWQHLTRPGEKLYSQEIGDANAIWLGFAAGVLAIGVLLLITRPWQLHGMAALTGWLPCLCLVFAGLSLHTFFRQRETGFNPRRYSVPFIVSFYLFNLIHGLTVNQHLLRSLV